MSTPLRQQAEAARRASRALLKLDRRAKDRGLRAIAHALRAEAPRLHAANELDLKLGREAGLATSLLDRLDFGPRVLEATAAAVEEVAAFDDPVGSRGPTRRLPNGLSVTRQRLPLGVIAMVYESRPNVTVDAASLCLKAGNAVLLRGGKEAAHSNAALGEVLRGALSREGLPEEAVQIVPAGDRESIAELVSLTGLVDLCIPRGGEGLIRFVAERARVPVVNHYQGVCHLYVDEDADLEQAIRIAVDAKASRPSACNALECLLVHAGDAPRTLPPILDALAARGVELRGCERTRALYPAARPAGPGDFGTEFLALTLAIKLVDSVDEAIAHVERYGSNHTEAILTPKLRHAERWVREVDASCVLVNASTRFNDGGQLGLGAEIGISTSKLHAYGPMGLESLTTEKWVVHGDGQARS